MARKSKFGAAGKERITEKSWKAGLYIRLSREDGDKEESDSVFNQRVMLSEFVEKMQDIDAADYFIDNGWTGTNFNRPGFISMMKEIKAGKINCIIVKNLSRFGRNYIEVGNYLEQIFPFLSVRFISVGDYLDSVVNPEKMNTISLPFKNLVNDMYCRDISDKVRRVLDSKRNMGKFIGTFSGYGFLKDPDNKGELLVDKEDASVIRKIFEWFLDGQGVLTIAKRLNELGVYIDKEYPYKPYVLWGFGTGKEKDYKL